MAEHHPVPRAIFALEGIQPDLKRHLRRFGAVVFDVLAVDTGMAAEATLVSSDRVAGLAGHLVQVILVMLLDLAAGLDIFVAVLAGGTG